MKHAILAMALLLPLPAYSEAIDIDRSRSVGPTVAITTPSGIICSETAGDRPSFWLGGRIRQQNDDKIGPTNTNDTIINSTIHDGENGASVGLGVHIPFGGPDTGNCEETLAIAVKESKLKLLTEMLATKVISFEEYKTRALQLYDK